MVVANNKINDNKKCRQIAGNFDCHADKAVQGGAHRPISASVASCKTTRCHHQASACPILPQQPPWLTILAANKKTLTKHNFHLANLQ
jgi:hypothetical protein